MTVFVDDPMPIGGRFHNYCHLWSDTSLEELLHFAQQLGLKPEWLQSSATSIGEFLHFDISPAKRQLALQKGARYKKAQEWVKERRNRKR